MKTQSAPYRDKDNSKKKILICPLNWGLGHATRCEPLIRQLTAEGHEVVIAADGYPLQFLRKQFPRLRTIESKSYLIRYSKSDTQVWALLRFLPRLLGSIVKEHCWLKQTVRHEHFDQIISDNRFGLWNKHVHSIYITHQVMIKMPRRLQRLEPLVYRLHRLVINRYDACWIPDYANDGGLSGDLSHKYPAPSNARYVGTLSRFERLTNVDPNTDYHTVVILSGVEPQRSMFEAEMIRKYKDVPEKTMILRGQPCAEERVEKIGMIDLVSHCEDEPLAATLKGCKTIVCRAGYSTVMDMEVLGVLHKAEYYPTHGQTEQEYLAAYLSAKSKSRNGV